MGSLNKPNHNTHHTGIIANPSLPPGYKTAQISYKYDPLFVIIDALTMSTCCLHGSNAGGFHSLPNVNSNEQKQKVMDTRRALVKRGPADVWICKCCIRVRARISIRAEIRVSDKAMVMDKIMRWLN